MAQGAAIGVPTVLPLVSYVCMPSPLPRQVRWNRFAQYCSIECGLPQISVRSAPALSVSRPAQRSLALQPADSPSRLTRWSDPVPGRAFHPAVDQRLPRRTVIACLSIYSQPVCPLLILGIMLPSAVQVETLNESRRYHVQNQCTCFRSSRSWRFMLCTCGSSSGCRWGKHRTGSRVSLRIFRLCPI